MSNTRRPDIHISIETARQLQTIADAWGVCPAEVLRQIVAREYRAVVLQGLK